MTPDNVRSIRSEVVAAGGRDQVLPAAGRRHLVKIDGLRQTDHAVAAVETGADLIGFIFAPARRQVSADFARDAIAAAKDLRPEVLAVGVFVNAGANEINEVADLAGLDLVQLHGDEPPDLLPRLVRPVIKVVKPPPGTPAADVERLLDAFSAVDNAPVLFLMDGYRPGVAGGEGIRADWALARDVARTWPLFLAGGLDPENVNEAITFARPAGVDVSSGVETDGIKDPAKVVQFVANARAAFARLAQTTT